MPDEWDPWSTADGVDAVPSVPSVAELTGILHQDQDQLVADIRRRWAVWTAESERLLDELGRALVPRDAHATDHLLAQRRESCAGRMQEDPESGARYIYVTDIAPGDVARTATLGLCHVHLDYDAEGRILGVELL